MVLSCKCHTFGSKLPWLRGVSAILLGRDSGTLATSDNGQQTTDNSRGGSRWGYAGIMELRNYGTMDRASRLKAQSLSIPFYTLYTHNSLLTVVMR